MNKPSKKQIERAKTEALVVIVSLAIGFVIAQFVTVTI
jgi:hypothetical protein